MRTIEWTRQFKRDYRRARATPRYKNLDEPLEHLTSLLAQDFALARNCRDHALGGNWRGFRECHLFPDLLLVYDKPDPMTLLLVRLASHSELFG